jgi:hypothetical protein
MRVAHDFPSGSGRKFSPRKIQAIYNGAEGRKYNASHWRFWQKRRDLKTMNINRRSGENTGRNNEAIIVLWTSGCKDGVDLAALSAWLARGPETKGASRASREAQFVNSHLCH